LNALIDNPIMNTGVIMKKNKKMQNVLIRLVLVAVSITVFLEVYRQSTPLNNISLEGYGWVSMIRTVLIDEPVKNFANTINDFTYLWAMKEENDALRKQIRLLAIYQARLEESYREIQALKALNDLKQVMSEYHLVNAMILNRSQVTYMHSLTLNIGSDDNVVINSAVISVDGLIGKVIDVQSKTCTVKLLTTEQAVNKVSVKIQIDAKTVSEAILEYYDSNEHAYILTLLETDYTITNGMKVITSGLGEAFPSGLPVGTVIKVEELQNALGVKIYVSPAADFNNLDYVSVVLRGIE
jgi:rod shape-determining protein MreC